MIWLLVAGHSSPASLMVTVETGCRTAAAGGMTEQSLMAVLPVHLTTMTRYHLHFGSFKAIISKFLEVMTVLIQDYSKLIAVPVGERLEALSPALVTSDIAPPGTATHVVNVVL